MLRDECLVAARDADGVLEMAAEREHRRPRSREPDRARRVAAGAADELRAAARALGTGAQHAVVAAGHDGAVVHEEGVGDAREPTHRLDVAGDKRLAARIRAGHHEHEVVRLGEPTRTRGPPARLVEQQELQRRVRQHRAEPGEPGRNPGQRVVDAWPFAQQHDRPLGAPQQRVLHGRDVREWRTATATFATMTANGFSSRALRSRKPRHGVAVASIADQVESAESLDRDDLAAAQAGERGRDRILAVQRDAVRIEQRQRAARTRDRHWAPRGTGDAPAPGIRRGTPDIASNGAMLVVARS